MWERAVLLVLACRCLGGVWSTDGPPNVVILLVDDLGYGDLGCFGNTTLSTPNIDSLARDGVRLTDLYVPTPVCTPSRSSLLTGRHAVRTGMVSDLGMFIAGNSPALPSGLPHSEYTIAEMLKEKGYDTHMVGKWHLGINDNRCMTSDTESDLDAEGLENQSCAGWWGISCLLRWLTGAPTSEGDCTYQNGMYLPIHHGFDNYYGMPVTNTETCDPLYTIYSDDYLIVWILRMGASVLVPVVVVLFFSTIFGFLSARSFAQITFLVIPLALFIAHYYISSYTLLARNSCILYRNNELVEQPVVLETLTTRFTKEAVGFIENHTRSPTGPRPAPFFLFMSYVKVHTALFTEPYNKGKSIHGEYGDNVMEMDWSVGEIRSALDSAGVTENTLVFFTSDNGPYLERRQRGGFQGRSQSAECTGPDCEGARLKGGKGQTWEGGIRVPGIVSWPPRIPRGVDFTHPVSVMDFLPTIATAVGAPLPKMHLDGSDLLSNLATNEPVHDVLFYFCGKQNTAARYGHFKIHYMTAAWEDGLEFCPNAKFMLCPCHGQVHDPPLVYNLLDDPGELSPLPSDEVAEVLAHVQAARHRFLLDLQNDTHSFPGPAEGLARPWLMPCCDFPTCQCQEEE